MDIEELLDSRVKNVGWSVFIVQCSDESYYVGMTRNMKREMDIMNSPKNVKNHWYFKSFPQKLPVTLVFEERNVPFREAYAKKCYLNELNRKQRDKLIRTKKWCNSWPLYYYGYRMKDKDFFKNREIT